ncbi:hypothetical protein KVV02_002081 [Mortierella alpina]|uniref:glucan endo-1,3-beta-D-glucosidase n=1 Tax=Mortierella alpina TaxID=64518 RepID=A0A9P7ZWU5_MORAP|nr:hypothetical protein KVV02_002081 [Mortierella alpina]
MSQYNHLPDNASGVQYSSHNRTGSQSASFYNQQDATDYDSSNSFPMVQQMTPQQRRQEERRRHAEASTSESTTAASAAAAAAAAAGTGASPWLSKQQKKSSKWKTIAWSVFALLLIALAGILAWYFVVHKKNESNSKNSNAGNGGGHATGPTVVTPNGTVVPNTNHPLKRVFYGMAYVPIGAQLPDCYNTQNSVDEELQLLVQTTKRVRLYGTDCNVLRYTMDSIQRLKLDLKVVVGIWIDKDNATYTRQSTEFFNVMSTYGWTNIIGVSVGNEVIFDNYQPLHVLMAHVAEIKAKVVAMGQPDIPVFTSDLEAANKPPLTNQEDKAGVNLHPFFSGVPVSDAASWFWKYLKESVHPAVNQGNAQPIDVWITEVGWPTFPANGNKNASIPSIPNLQTFLDTWLCEANKQNLPYYYFEFFDAPWKIWPGHAVEGFWGLLTIDKKLKVKLPDCISS